jgi:alkanesulfonate monooxygenase SsuD/methylene tetrahydromethanopterin reductase-like flavin-dependent oxidoreductase (luciferase family)
LWFKGGSRAVQTIEEDERADLDDGPAPTSEAIETFTLSDEELTDEVEYNPFERRKPKGAHHPSAWIQGPGMVELLAEASRLLITATELKGQLDEQLAFVRVTALRKKRCLVVAPTTEADLKKVPVRWRESKAHFLASAVLLAAGFPVETGYKKRFEVHLIKTSKKGPILVIDLRRDLDVTVLPKRKRKPKGA